MFCPNPQMPLWSSHPRVFLDIAETGEAMCPYCGTRYRLERRPAKGGGTEVDAPAAARTRHCQSARHGPLERSPASAS